MSSGRVIDNMARKVLMASLLYYRHDTLIMPDGDFDRICLRLAVRWFALDPHLKWQMGSAHDLGAGGAHVKITKACEGGALAWAKTRLLTTLPALPDSEWKWDESRALHWASAS